MKTLPRVPWIALTLALCLLEGPSPATGQVGIVERGGLPLR